MKESQVRYSNILQIYSAGFLISAYVYIYILYYTDTNLLGLEICVIGNRTTCQEGHGSETVIGQTNPTSDAVHSNATTTITGYSTTITSMLYQEYICIY